MCTRDVSKTLYAYVHTNGKFTIWHMITDAMSGVHVWPVVIIVRRAMALLPGYLPAVSAEREAKSHYYNVFPHVFLPTLTRKLSSFTITADVIIAI